MKLKRWLSCTLTVVGLVAALGTPASADYAVEVYNASFDVSGIIHLVGLANGAVDPLGEFTVHLTQNGLDVAGKRITIAFTGCPDIAIAHTQPFLGISATSNCEVYADTDNGGVATFRVVGGATASACNPNVCQAGGPGAFVTITDGSIIHLLAELPVACFDLDQANGVGSNDLSLWLTDYGCSNSKPMRSDYDGNGSVGANDLSFWLTVFGGSSAQSGSNFCYP